jgi:hypothetical protein
MKIPSDNPHHHSAIGKPRKIGGWGCFGIVLAALGILGGSCVWYLITVPMARLEETRRQQQARFEASAKKSAAKDESGQPGSAEEQPKGVLMSDLPFLGRYFSKDAAVRDAIDSEVQPLTDFYRAAGETVKRADVWDYAALAARLGLPLPEGATEKQAMEAVRQYALAKFGPILEPWVWPPFDPSDGSIYASNKLALFSRVFRFLAHTATEAGDTASASEAHQSLRLVENRLLNAENPVLIDVLIANSIENYRSKSVLEDIGRGAFTDTQLQELFQEAATKPKPLTRTKKGLEAEIANLQSYLANPEKLQQAYQPSVREDSLRGAFQSMHDSLFGEIVAKNNLLRNQAHAADVWERISDDGVYAHEGASGTAVVQTMEQQVTWLEKLVFSPIPGNPETYGNIARQGQDAQARQDIYQLSLALEMHRRQSGGYPDGLQSLTPHFPNGLPQDPILKEAYHYEKSDGGFRLWGVGRDGVSNNGGDLDVRLSR